MTTSNADKPRGSNERIPLTQKHWEAWYKRDPYWKARGWHW
jgi:hypothetical protein